MFQAMWNKIFPKSGYSTIDSEGSITPSSGIKTTTPLFKSYGTITQPTSTPAPQQTQKLRQ